MNKQTPYYKADVPGNGKSPETRLGFGQTRSGKSTLMMNFLSQLLTPPADGEKHA
ncbi:hypothetical protein [Candidatus Pantoea multigeneris]|uniref:hypothetical protein n=1 Tax=Candidatus Pantoea multigeneris TaxID=2608357 RepID=UPI001420D64C|nr:hypothetical protein [Pantoea multigeneris]